jgi:hypothetical protein
MSDKNKTEEIQIESIRKNTDSVSIEPLLIEAKARRFASNARHGIGLFMLLLPLVTSVILILGDYSEKKQEFAMQLILLIVGGILGSIFSSGNDRK